MTSESGLTTFIFYAVFQFRPNSATLNTNSKATRLTLTRTDGNLAELTHILVVTQNVIDRFAIKFTLCNKMQLGSQV